jgi:hypothetical protein
VQGPGGGLIFFVDYNDQYSGFDYLEAAPVSCQPATDMKWSLVQTAVPAAGGWAASAVGQGQANTTAILAVFTTATTTDNAAKYADALSCGGKDDWFLGSIGEMMLMYTNLRQAGVGTFQDVYWSSTQVSTQDAFYQHFSDGNQAGHDKTQSRWQRSVRSF